MNYKIFSPQDFPSYLPKLNLLYDDLFSGGKGFRSQLVGMVSRPLSVPVKLQNLLAQTIEFIHNASLLHDDLVDRSQLRRGKKAAWVKYSPEYAVLAGDYLLARVMVNLSSHGNIRLVQYTSEVISDLLEGEWLQDSVVGDFQISMQQLDRIHNLKTASLFKWCLRAPFIAIENNALRIHELLSDMGSVLGLLFQRSDDLLDYDVRNEERKAILGDLKSGYLNSFGAFLTQTMSKQEVQNFSKSTDLDQLKECLREAKTASIDFNEKVTEFDEINQGLIDLYEHHLIELESLLQSDEQKKLIESLRPLTEVLYWRRNPTNQRK